MQIPASTNESNVDESTKLSFHRKKAERRRGSVLALFGLLVAPIFMGSFWLMFNDMALTRKAGSWIFYVGSLGTVISYLKFTSYLNRLKSLSQSFYTTSQGISGAVREKYRTIYDFDKFRLTDYSAHKFLHFWGNLVGFSISSLFSYGYASYFFNHFVWS